MTTHHALQPGERVAVTGASGFVGANVVRRLLQRGFAVRAVVRDASDSAKTAPIRAAIADLDADAQNRLDFGSGDLLKAGSYDDALKGCAAVAHVAAVARLGAKDPQREIVDPSVRGVEHVYAAAERSGSVRRIVHTSSIVAVLRYDDARKGNVFDESDWNTESTLQTDPYGLAKTLAERRAWELAEAQAARDGFDVVVINPGVRARHALHQGAYAQQPSDHRRLDDGRVPGAAADALQLRRRGQRRRRPRRGAGA